MKNSKEERYKNGKENMAEEVKARNNMNKRRKQIETLGRGGGVVHKNK
jgi:hypothetical protein